MRRCGGDEWAHWLASHGHRRARGASTRASSCCSSAMPARCARAPSPTQAELRPRRGARADPGSSRRWRGRRSSPAVSSVAPAVYNEDGRVRVAVVDYGAKTSIMRRLRRAGAAVTVFPHAAARRRARRRSTASCSRTAPATRSRSSTRSRRFASLLGRTSVLGICLGHQLLGLATGHETYKLPFGHRGANHPVLERATGRVLVTSQNHGFAVAPSERPRGDVRLALRRHRRGIRLPGAERALGAVPSRGRAGHARRVADPRALGRAGWWPPDAARAPTSRRSA